MVGVQRRQARTNHSKAIHKLDADSVRSVRDEEDVRSDVICVRVGEISRRDETRVEQIVNEKAGLSANKRREKQTTASATTEGEN